MEQPVYQSPDYEDDQDGRKEAVTPPPAFPGRPGHGATNPTISIEADCQTKAPMPVIRIPSGSYKGFKKPKPPARPKKPAPSTEVDNGAISLDSEISGEREDGAIPALSFQKAEGEEFPQTDSEQAGPMPEVIEEEEGIENNRRPQFPSTVRDKTNIGEIKAIPTTSTSFETGDPNAASPLRPPREDKSR